MVAVVRHNREVPPAPGTVIARLRVAPDLAAAGEARRTVAPLLEAQGLDALTEDVLLTVGELVANAVLHARTDIELAVLRVGDGVRVEVRDRSPVPVTLPAPPAPTGSLDLDDLLAGQTMTGRGLRLVAGLADAWGMERRGDGKVVWAEIGTGAIGHGTDAVGHATGGTEGSGGTAGTGGTEGSDVPAPHRRPPHPAELRLHPVRLVGVPVRLALASDDNLDDLVREFQVVTMGEGAAQPPVPARLVELVEEVLERYAPQRGGLREATRQAVARGQRLLDVDVAVPPDAVADLWHLTGVLDEVAHYCREGALLSLAPSEELTAFRRWFVSELERQTGGSPPRPCPFPVVAPDDPATVAASVEADLLLAERSARVAAEQAAAQLAALHSVAAALTRAVDSHEVAEVVLVQGVAALGGRRGSLCFLRPDGETVEIVRHVGYPEEVTRHWRTFGVSDDLPASEAIRTGATVVLRTIAERNARYPIFAKTPVLDDPAFASVPLPASGTGRPFGALVLNFREATRCRSCAGPTAASTGLSCGATSWACCPTSSWPTPPST